MQIQFLLGRLSGELELDEGHLVRSRSTKVGYVPQEVPAAYTKLTVREVMEKALARGGSEGEDWRIDVMLAEIEMDLVVAEGRYDALSGGWQRLVLVACAALLEDPDILVLDEPTNHLDLGNIATLERWLTETIKLPMLIVSHDREFLNRVTDRTIFLRSDGAHSFKTRFSEARQTLLERDAHDARRRSLEEKEIRRLEEACARYKVWAQKNDEFDKRRKIMEGRIQRMEAAKTQTYVARERRLELADGDIEAKAALRLEGLTVATPDGRPLINIERFLVRTGDRVALLGVNGAGKSTMLEALALGLRGPRRPLRRQGQGAVQSGLPAGGVRPGHGRAAAARQPDRIHDRYRRRHRARGDPVADQGRVSVPAAVTGDRAAEFWRAGAADVPAPEGRAAQLLPAGRAHQPPGHRGPGGPGEPALRSRRLVPVRLPRPLLHPRRRHPLPGNPPRQAGGGRRPRRLLRVPDLRWIGAAARIETVAGTRHAAGL